MGEGDQGLGDQTRMTGHEGWAFSTGARASARIAARECVRETASARGTRPSRTTSKAAEAAFSQTAGRSMTTSMHARIMLHTSVFPGL